MIDRTALKKTARLSLPGKKPSTYLVAALYIAILSILSILTYALSGYDRFYEYIMQAIPVNPNLSAEELLSAFPAIRPEAGLLMFLILALRFLIGIGFLSYCLKISRDENADIKSLFDAFSFFLKVIWLEILRLIFTLLWSVLLIVPGIVAYYSYRQAFYILLDQPELRALDCLRQSKRLMNGHKTELFMLDVSFIGWFIVDFVIEALAILPLFSIWLSPYVGVTRAHYYNHLKAGTQADGGPA